MRMFLTLLAVVGFAVALPAVDNTNPKSVSIIIVDEYDVPIDGRIFCVGQLMNLHLRPTPAGATVTDIHWTIPDTKIRNWQSGKLTPFDPGTLTQQPILYYWLDGNVNKDVSATAKVNGKDASTKSTVTVEMPIINSYTSKTGTVDPIPAHNGLFLGNGNGNKGIEWTGDVTAPPHFSGSYRFTQIIGLLRQSEFNYGFFHTNGRGLDNTEAYDIPLQKAAGVRFTIKSNDNPGYKIDPTNNTLLGYMVGHNAQNEEFNTYIMFKPDTPNPDPIWVTIGLLDWNWHASVSRPTVTSAWGAPTGGPVPVDPAGAQSISLPLWSQVFTNGQGPSIVGPIPNDPHDDDPGP